MENTNKKLQIVFGDAVLGVHGKDFHYLFSYSRGGMESMVIDGMEWLYREPRPTFWRALTDNDRGSQFHLKSGAWLAADMFMKCTAKEIFIDGNSVGIPVAPENNRFSGTVEAEKVKVEFSYETITVPSTTVDISYEVDTDGQIQVSVWYHGKSGLPELPVFGMRFVMPTKAVGYKYKGLSGETYPDRMAGGIEGIYEVEGLPVTPYLVPQDCGMHMQTDWVEIYRNTCLNRQKKNACEEGKVHTLCFEAAEESFGFSCLPYTAEELENALHQEELPPARRTVVCICGAVRGVGGIDSWGADVEEPYRISGEKDVRFTFYIKKSKEK